MEIFLIDSPPETGSTGQVTDIATALDQLQAVFGGKRIRASTQSPITTRTFDPTYTTDGTHFNDLGNEIWGTDVAYDIKKYR